MNEEAIKQSFAKVKQDMTSLQEQINYLSQQIEELKRTLQTPTHPAENPTLQHIIPTHNLPLQALKSSKTPFSTGNQGVPTNKPTNQQTNQHIGNEGVSALNFHENSQKPTQEISKNKQNIDEISKIKHISDILASLDELKKEVRVKFKRLTEQEMAVFSAIYQLEEQNIDVDYQLLSQQLKLSEISIRDYIRKIIKKGIPIEKIKHDNNKLTISINEYLNIS
mgnify:FL=1